MRAYMLIYLCRRKLSQIKNSPTSNSESVRSFSAITYQTQANQWATSEKQTYWKWNYINSSFTMR